MSAVALLQALSPKFAQAQMVAPNDARLVSRRVEFASPAGNGKAGGLLVRPAAATGKLPGILVIHENRGLNPHIEDIARRLALDNFVVLAPDALFPIGGYPGDEDKARAAFGDARPGQDARRLPRRRGLPEGAPGEHRQDRRGRLLLRRRRS